MPLRPPSTPLEAAPACPALRPACPAEARPRPPASAARPRGPACPRVGEAARARLPRRRRGPAPAEARPPARACTGGRTCPPRRVFKSLTAQPTSSSLLLSLALLPDASKTVQTAEPRFYQPHEEAGDRGDGAARLGHLCTSLEWRRGSEMSWARLRGCEVVGIPGRFVGQTPRLIQWGSKSLSGGARCPAGEGARPAIVHEKGNPRRSTELQLNKYPITQRSCVRRSGLNMVLSIHQNYMMRVVAIAALYLLQLQAITPVLLAVAATNLPSPGCISKCGEISIPFPFGVSAGCYRKGFKLTCNETYNPPKLFMDNTRAEVLDISLHHGKLYVDNGIISLTGGDGYSMTWGIPLDDSIFTVSPFWNNFVIMGCGFEFRVSLPDSQNMVVRCTSTCLGGRPAVAIDGVCSGVGCCQASMPGAGNMYSIKLASYPYTAVEDVTIPGRPFNATLVMVENEWWNTDSHSMLVQKGVSDGLITPTGPVQTKAVVKWNFSNLSCADAQSSSVSGCLSYNSYCHDHWTGKSSGHICRCSDGYEGNPYIPNGCQDIDECAQPDKYKCFGHCVNMDGSYNCICPHGTSGNPQKPHGCIKATEKFSGLAVATGFGSGALLLLLTFSAILIRGKLRAQKAKQLRDFFFRKNRGLLLQQLVDKDIAERMIFSLEELEKATNTFDDDRKIGKGGHGTVYKGILSDQRVVAIKRSTRAIQSETGNFINEVAILSQINHRYVVKLFGCCLETEVPLLVYEFISNGTLYDHLHVSSSLSLPWRERLRIALEVARSLAYLHSAASVSIIHRDIKATNILLDDNLTAKVSDFGASRGIPIDETRVTTAIQGTFGYLDPECYNTRQLTEKSDVYSFGVMLVELLTREKPHSYMSPAGYSLVEQFLLLHNQRKLSEILDPQVAREGDEDAMEVAEVAAMCISSSGEDRPMMKQVEMRLETLQSASTNIGNNPRTEEHVVNIPSAGPRSGDTDGSRRFSMEKEILLSMEFPR